MEPEASNYHPLSPKKKLKTNTSDSSEVTQFNPSDSEADATQHSEAVDAGSNHSACNGLAPTRAGRGISPSPSHSSNSLPHEDVESISESRPNVPARAMSIQEEEVSSSENCVIRKKTENSCDGDADSLTNGEPDDRNLPLSSEASEKKDNSDEN